MWFCKTISSLKLQFQRRSKISRPITLNLYHLVVNQSNPTISIRITAAERGSLTIKSTSNVRTIPKTTISALNPLPTAIKMPEAENSRPLVFNFTSHSSTSSFTASSQTYLSNHPGAKYKYIATGALVFENSNHTGPRILLIQRSKSDSMPSRWEIPGGGCDDDDKSILHAVARELWEEAGLNAASIGPLVGKPHFFVSRSGKQVCKFNFLVEVEQITKGRLEVKLNPVEHQSFVWANEEEVKARKVGDVELEFTTKDLEDTVLEAFRFGSEVKCSS
jgi:8-oxo-dGTP pyrophosphatase MutT (NUDIX family)